MRCGERQEKGHVTVTRFGPNRVAADMEGNGEFDFLEIFEDFWRISWRFLEFFWGILEKLVRCEKKIKNFNQLETNKENEVLRPLRPPNSLGVQIWHQIWNVWPKLHVLPYLCGLFWPVWAKWREKEEHLALLDLSASPQVKSYTKAAARTWPRLMGHKSRR